MRQSVFSRWFPRAMGFACCASILAALAGCGGSSGGQKLAPVHGKVAYKGVPLAKGRITFMPLKPGNSSSGEIVNGEYKLSTYEKNDGAPPGKYKVAVTAWVKEPDMQSQGEPAIPQRYFDAEKSQLTADVTDKPGSIDFDLKE